MRLRKRWSQGPITQIAYMSLKHRINTQLIRPWHSQQRISRLIRPIQAQSGSIGNEEIVKRDGRKDLDHFVAHSGPGEVVYPGWVWGEDLGGPGGNPVGKAVVRFLCGGYLPAHY